MPSAERLWPISIFFKSHGLGDDHNGTREFHKKTYGPDFTYGDFGNMFKVFYSYVCPG